MTHLMFSMVRDYLRAAAVLYGCIPLMTLFRIFSHHNGDQLTADVFCRLARAAQGPAEPFRIIGDDDIYRADLPVADTARCVVHRQYCYATWDALFTLMCSQEGKPTRLFTKEQMLLYARGDYIPDTPQNRDLAQVLGRYTQGPVPLPQILEQAVISARADDDAPAFLKQMQQLGCRFGTTEDRLLAAQSYQGVYETVPKPIHNGHSDQELRALLGEEKPLQRYFAWFCPGSRRDGFRLAPQWLAQEYPVTGITDHQRLLSRCMAEQTLPPRLLEPCFCGSGLNYEDCCGKR